MEFHNWNTITGRHFNLILTRLNLMAKEPGEQSDGDEVLGLVLGEGESIKYSSLKII